MLKKIFVGSAILASALIFCLLLLELTLKTGFFDRADDPSPIWIPNSLQKIDKKINDYNWRLAKLNPYGFTDLTRNVEKKPGTTRIAILGDSVIWGYGLPYEQVWSHKLEKMIIEKYKNFEIMSWGLSAWSTMDELSFLEKHGIKYDIDTLIVGFVDNDPDMGEIPIKTYPWQKNILIKILKIFFPDSISFIASYTNNLLTKYVYTDYQYENWVKELYSNKNLLNYLEILQDFSIFCNSKNIKLILVLTPQRYDESIREEFNKIIPLLEQANIKYLNLFPAVKKDLRHINPRKLWANPANGHPGPLLTDLYAKYTFNYLEKEGIFLRDTDSQVQTLLEWYGKNKKDFSAIRGLLNIALNKSDWDIRKEAAIALGKINDPRAIDPLITAFKDNNSIIREAATDALGEINDPRTIEPLLSALRDEANNVRRRAILALEKKNERRIIEPLINIAKKDEDQYIRRRALLALSKINDDRVINCLIDCLKDSFYYNRKTAVIALGKTRSPLAVAPLIQLLNDGMRDIRAETAEALGEIGATRSIEALKIASLKDKDPYVRDLAADAIKKITGKEYGKYRRKLLRAWQKYF